MSLGVRSLRGPAWSRPASGRRLLEPLLIALAVVAALGGGVATAAVHPAAGVAALIGMMAAIGVLVNTRLGLMAFILVATLLPFAVFPVPLLGSLKPTFLDAALTGLLLAWLFRFLGKPATGLVRTPLDPFILVFIGLAMVSFTIGVESVSAEASRFFLKTINSMIFFFSVTNVLRERKHLDSAVRMVVLAAFLASVVALVLYVLPAGMSNRFLNFFVPFGYPSGIVLRYIAGTDTLRAIGTSIDPNILGGTLVLLTPLALSLLLGQTAMFRRWQLAVMAGAMILAMILSFSRGSLLGLVAAGLFMAGARYRKLFVLLAVFGLVLYFLPMGDVVVDRLQAGVQFGDQASAMRLGEYKDALRLISMYPWFGVGFGQAPSIDLYVAAASIYLLMAEEMGLVGVAAFLATIAAVFVNGLRAMVRMQDFSLRTIQTGALAGVLGAMVAGLFDHHFFNLNFPHTVALFWLMVGLAVVSTRLGTQAADEDHGEA